MTSTSPKGGRHPGGSNSNHGGSTLFLNAARSDWSMPPQADALPPAGAKVLKLKGKHGSHGQLSSTFHGGGHNGAQKRHHDGSTSPRDRDRAMGHSHYRSVHERSSGGYGGHAQDFGLRDRDRGGRGAHYRSKSSDVVRDHFDSRTDPLASTMHAADVDRRQKNMHQARAAAPLILKDELKPMLLEALKEFSESILQPALKELRGDVRADMSSITRDLGTAARPPGRMARGARYENPPPLPDPPAMLLLQNGEHSAVKGAILDDAKLPGVPDAFDHGQLHRREGSHDHAEGNLFHKKRSENEPYSDMLQVAEFRDEEVVRPPQQVCEAPLVRSLDASESCVDHESLVNGHDHHGLKRHHHARGVREEEDELPTLRKELTRSTTALHGGKAEQRRVSASLSQPNRIWAGLLQCFGVLVTSFRSTVQGERSMKEIVDSSMFDNISGVVILINAITIGIQTDHMARHVTEDVPLGMEILDKGIAVFFLMELVVRLYAFRCSFFYMPGYRWNWFDLVLVLLQIMEELMRSLIIGSGGGGGTSSAAQSATNTGGFKIMRIMRVLRLIRVVRVVRMLRIIGELRSILASVAGSLQSLGWTVVLLVLLMYMVGVYFTQTVTDFRVEFPDEHLPDEVLEHYQTLGATIYHLYQAVSGGIDWGDMCTPLMESIGIQAGVAFIIYIAFVVLCIMNVVTGVFVDSALKNAQQEDSDFMVTNLTAVFNTTDIDQNGHLSLQEFEASVSSDSMKRYFDTIDLDPAEAMTLFKLLDIDGSGEVQMEEFVSGCIRLRGQAKAIDVMTIMWENRHYSRVFFRHARALEKNLELLFEALDSMCLRLGIEKCFENTNSWSPTQRDAKVTATLASSAYNEDALTPRVRHSGPADLERGSYAARRVSVAVHSDLLAGVAAADLDVMKSNIPSPLRPPSAKMAKQIASRKALSSPGRPRQT